VVLETTPFNPLSLVREAGFKNVVALDAPRVRSAPDDRSSAAMVQLAVHARASDGQFGESNRQQTSGIALSDDVFPKPRVCPRRCRFCARGSRGTARSHAPAQRPRLMGGYAHASAPSG
jgi:hypothetical protein